MTTGTLTGIENERQEARKGTAGTIIELKGASKIVLMLYG